MGNYNATHKIVRDSTGREVLPGDQITFRGEPWTFEYISRVPGDGTATNGKIVVSHQDGYKREYYPSVFDLTVEKRLGVGVGSTLEAFKADVGLYTVDELTDLVLFVAGEVSRRRRERVKA